MNSEKNILLINIFVFTVSQKVLPKAYGRVFVVQNMTKLTKINPTVSYRYASNNTHM